MEPFLKKVAQDIYGKYGNHLADIAIIFPNKRAGLFFNEYLKKLSDSLIWSPVYMTINELFQENSDCIEGDPILLISRLHKEYCRQTGSNESLDKFYYWGEMLIKDFNEIDKNMVDAAKLFANLKELRQIGSAADILDDTQREAIQQFFANFKPEEDSEVKRRFCDVWEALLPIYTNLRKTLRSEGIAYSGMLCRDVIENDRQPDFPYEKYIFVGFNALNSVEDAMFRTLQEQGKALFYWDYDTAYTDNKHHEAGRFMQNNLLQYPNALEGEEYNNLNKKKNITFVSAATDNIQTRHLAEKLQEITEGNEIETAVVLCDEGLLDEVLHSIPPSIKNLNVTMGYPVTHTPVYSFMQRLIEVQINGYDSNIGSFRYNAVHGMLKHPYTLQCSENAAKIDETITKEHHLMPNAETLHADEFLKKIFTPATDCQSWINNIRDIIYTVTNSSVTEENDTYEELFRESLFSVYTQAQRILSLLESGELTIQLHTLASLFMRIIATLKLPFHGEPVVGLQVMGLLETRNLDFRNLILLSANDSNLPRNVNDSSFIPYNLRRAFGLMLNEQRNAVYSYNFHRLMQRAENITMMYNNSTENDGERSRYMLQMLTRRADEITEIHLNAGQKCMEYRSGGVMKTPQMIEKLRNIFDNGRNSKAQVLSPSGINRYLDCPMKFFYYYLGRLRDKQEVEETIQAADFGNIFHKAAELFYEHIVKDGGAYIQKSQLEPYMQKTALLYPFVDEAFKECFFKNIQDEKPQYDGLQYINREVLQRFLVRLIKMDAQHTPFRYVGSEQPVSFSMMATTAAGEQIPLNIGGRIDRIDQKGDTLEIVDYKTGGEPDSPDSIDSLFSPTGKRNGYIFQAMLYSAAMADKEKGKKISPSLIYIHNKETATREDYIVSINKKDVTDFSTFDDGKMDVTNKQHRFLTLLQQTINEIFDINIPFACTVEKNRCRFCSYRTLCGEQ